MPRPAGSDGRLAYTPRTNEAEQRRDAFEERDRDSRHYEANKEAIDSELKARYDADKQAEAERYGFSSWEEMWEHPFWKDSDKI